MENFVEVPDEFATSDTHEWVARRIDRMSWLVRSDWQGRLSLVCKRGWHGGEVLRSLPHRQVLRFNGQPALVVKLFRHRGLTTLLKLLLRDTPALREWKKIHQALRLGIPTVKPLAVGRTAQILPRESVLVTELLKETLPVDAYLFGPRRASGSERRRAIQEIAGVVRKAHDAGWRQRDFHLGNILITPEPRAGKIFLIDFQRAEFLRRPADRLRWRDLAVLHGGSIAASRSDRLGFLKEYLSVAPRLSVDLRIIAAQLERRGLRHRFKLWRRRGKRCLADNREFVRIRQDGYCGAARRANGAGGLQRMLRNGSSGINGGEVIKDSRTTTVTVLPISENKIYVKRYNYQGWPYALKDLLRRARARRVWLAANGCVIRGLTVAPPLAYLERRRFGILLESYFMTGGVPGQTLTSWLVLHGGDSRRRRALVGALARFVARMHERRVQNRDLKFDNLIVVQEAPNSFGLFMVDFDGIAMGPVSWRARMKNIARLERESRRSMAVTRTDRLRYLKIYLGPRCEERWKRCWRAIARRAGVD